MLFSELIRKNESQKKKIDYWSATLWSTMYYWASFIICIIWRNYCSVKLIPGLCSRSILICDASLPTNHRWKSKRWWNRRKRFCCFFACTNRIACKLCPRSFVCCDINRPHLACILIPEGAKENKFQWIWVFSLVAISTIVTRWHWNSVWKNRFPSVFKGHEPNGGGDRH